MNKLLPLTLLFIGCTGADEALPLLGSWTDQYGSSHEITETTWTMDGMGVFNIEVVDTEAEYLIAQNDAANEYFPEMYSRMDWTMDGDTAYFCQAAYDAATPEDAEAATSADRGDLSAGCGGFEWSSLQ